VGSNPTPAAERPRSPAALDGHAVARDPRLPVASFHVDPGVELRQNGAAAVPSEVVGRFVRRYYETAEGVRPPYDSELAHLLAEIENHATIDLLSIAEYHRVPLRDQ
jgi:hypothetical protein